MRKMRDIGNKVIVVENDEEEIIKEDYVVDIGKEEGVNGGKVIEKGQKKDIMENKNQMKGKYM